MRCLYRIRRWDTDVLWLESRPLYKRFCAASIDADDLQFCGAAVGDAVLRWEMRIGGR